MCSFFESAPVLNPFLAPISALFFLSTCFQFQHFICIVLIPTASRKWSGAIHDGLQSGSRHGSCTRSVWILVRFQLSFLGFLRFQWFFLGFFSIPCHTYWVRSERDIYHKRWVLSLKWDKTNVYFLNWTCHLCFVNPWLFKIQVSWYIHMYHESMH